MIDIFQIQASLREVFGQHADVQRIAGGHARYGFDVPVFEVVLGDDAKQQAANLALRQARQHQRQAWHFGIAQRRNRSAPSPQQHENIRRQSLAFEEQRAEHALPLSIGASDQRLVDAIDYQQQLAMRLFDGCARGIRQVGSHRGRRGASCRELVDERRHDRRQLQAALVGAAKMKGHLQAVRHAGAWQTVPHLPNARTPTSDRAGRARCATAAPFCRCRDRLRRSRNPRGRSAMNSSSCSSSVTRPTRSSERSCSNSHDVVLAPSGAAMSIFSALVSMMARSRSVTSVAQRWWAME